MNKENIRTPQQADVPRTPLRRPRVKKPSSSNGSQSVSSQSIRIDSRDLLLHELRHASENSVETLLDGDVSMSRQCGHDINVVLYSPLDGSQSNQSISDWLRSMDPAWPELFAVEFEV